MLVDRRDILRTGSSIIISAGIAGCSGDNTGDGTESSENTDGNTNTNTENSEGSDGDTETSEDSSQDSPTRDGEWPQHRYDAENSAVTGASVASSVSEKWSIDHPQQAIPGAVRVHQGAVVVSSPAGFFAYDAGTGKQLWSSDRTGGDMITAADGNVYRTVRESGGSDTAQIITNSIEDGSQAGSQAVDDWPLLPLTVGENHVYAVTRTPELVALNKSLEGTVWKQGFYDYHESILGPAIDDEAVYIAHAISSNNSGVTAFDKEAGEKLWECEHGTESGPVVYDGRVYIENTTIDAESGEELWTASDAPGQSNPPAVTDDTVIYAGGTASQAERVYAVDPDTGDEQWSQTLEVDWVRRPVVASGNIYLGTSSGLMTLSLSDGTTGWSIESIQPNIEPIVLNDMVIIVSDSGISAYTP